MTDAALNELQRVARQALTLMDLTSLNDDDNDRRIRQLCEQADTPAGHPAAVCVYPAFVATARHALTEHGLAGKVRVATVTNFPHGKADVTSAASETREAIAAGADEVDVVFPYRAFMNGDEALGRKLVAVCKAACGKAPLKVILETGEWDDPEQLRRAADQAIAAGADFLKTSTGKVAVNATLEAAEILLTAIKESGQHTASREVGFKAAGGVKSAEDARAYLQLATRLMGEAWVTPEHFRFGASSLLGSLLDTLDAGLHDSTSGPPGGY
ncbi:deoxyribose-phosphate aldolase [Halomonas sp. TRM85114]|uniref:deoxyribose-phosphate aldolase n=1 Tax=Halomonas jincaotanensis TaxID=2810616 RepID=UPI001BD4E3AC|nr:deoxyribose-phosphate aldolase [Halomonas jincaotanensis]MBS9404558.1 deoxyribose-phosphate aldolase [Halomonas jincaotanensis]